jgi:hypothetical protein
MRVCVPFSDFIIFWYQEYIRSDDITLKSIKKKKSNSLFLLLKTTRTTTRIVFAPSHLLYMQFNPLFPLSLQTSPGQQGLTSQGSNLLGAQYSVGEGLGIAVGRAVGLLVVGL